MQNPQSAYERGLLRPFIAMTGVASDDEQSGIVNENESVDKLSRDERKHWKDAAMKIINDPARMVIRKETMTSILGGNGKYLEMFQICIEELFICQCLVTM